MTEATKETRGFETEAKQLLHLMIHSLYSNKEIFLRELVSNASDAADKLRFEALNHGEFYEDDSDLKINISFDKEANTVTISDNGIGMSREDVVDHLGTIAYMLIQCLSCTELVQFDLGSSVHYSTTANGILPVVGAGVGRVSSEVLTPLIDFSNSEIVVSKLVTCKTEFQSLLTKNHPTIL